MEVWSPLGAAWDELRVAQRGRGHRGTVWPLALGSWLRGYCMCHCASSSRVTVARPDPLPKLGCNFKLEPAIAVHTVPVIAKEQELSSFKNPGVTGSATLPRVPTTGRIISAGAPESSAGRLT
jgi:hypothetical protein